jgi:dihydroflavonol-4-reductase
MKVLVTGANGLLGHHVVFELVKRQYDVRVIVRNTENIHFDVAKTDVYVGNFTDYKSLKQAAAGCDAIIHIAAVTATHLLHYDDYSKINVEGSRLVLKVAEELNINRIVYVSSANTIGFGTEQEPADECFNIEFPFTESFYAQSKVASEQLFVEASKLPDMHVVIINPTFMIGSYDTKPSSGKLMLMGYKKRLMLVPKGGKNFVSAHDVAVSIYNALVEGQTGKRYLASGINLSFKEFYSLQSQIENYRQHIIELPDFILILAGKAGDLLRKAGIATEVCSMNLRQLMIKEYYRNSKAKAELHLPETDLKIAIKEAIDWFKNHNMT